MITVQITALVISRQNHVEDVEAAWKYLNFDKLDTASYLLLARGLDSLDDLRDNLGFC